MHGAYLIKNSGRQIREHAQQHFVALARGVAPGEHEHQHVHLQTQATKFKAARSLNPSPVSAEGILLTSQVPLW